MYFDIINQVVSMPQSGNKIMYIPLSILVDIHQLHQVGYRFKFVLLQNIPSAFRYRLRKKWRVLSQNELSAIFFIFKVKAPSYNTNNTSFSNNTFLIIYKGTFLKLWSKVLQIFLLFFFIFSSFNLKYLKLTKMELTRFAMKLFKSFRNMKRHTDI